jgi:radical SAM protein with 4Fe4S-binding SPASM domain
VLIIIRRICVDPNGLCNAKCWFCPVAYLGNPKDNKANMSIETMEDIFKQLDAGRGDFVDEQIHNTPIHYNEMLLYPYLEEMFELHRKYKITIAVYSNGVNLTKERTDLIKKYRDVVDEIFLNVPSLDQDQWAQFTGFNPKIFSKLVDNLKYAEEQLIDLFEPHKFFLMVNGIDQKTLFENGGWIDVLEDAPRYELDMESGTLANIVSDMKKVLPRMNIWGRNNLGDRTGVLQQLNIISNQKAIKQRSDGKVFGCSADFDKTFYVSATGNVYVCCQDFNYETVYANIKDKTIKEIWQGEERKKALEKAYAGVCTTCMYAVTQNNFGQKPRIW